MAWESVMRTVDLPVLAQHCARCIAFDAAHDLDAALVEFADPVGRQRTFIERGQFFHILRAGADQQPVDAGPDGGAVALAARLRGGGGVIGDSTSFRRGLCRRCWANM